MAEVVGIGKSTIAYDDFEETDLIIVMGQNPGTNHPRMLTALEDAKQERRRDRRRQPAARGRAAALQEPAEGPRHRRPRHPDRRPVPADPPGRRHGPAAGDLEARARRPSRPPRAPCSTTPSSPSTRAGSRTSSSTPAGRRRRGGPRDRPDDRAEIDEVAARYLKSKRTIITWAMGITQHTQGRRHDQGDHQPAAAAREHRQARRRRLADPRAQQRAGRPHDGHLGADAGHVPRRPGEGVPLRAPARARRRRAQGHQGDAAAARSSSGWAWAATSSPPSRTRSSPRRRSAAPR